MVADPAAASAADVTKAKKEKKPPAAPNTSAQCPCVHNDWDNVRVKKGFITLRCRQCQAQWKTETGNVKKCHNFFQGSCARGAACPTPHIHRYKQSLQKRQTIFGEDLDGSPLSSPLPSPDSGKRRRRRKNSRSPAHSAASVSSGTGSAKPGVSPASTPPLTPKSRRKTRRLDSGPPQDVAPFGAPGAFGGVPPQPQMSNMMPLFGTGDGGSAGQMFLQGLYPLMQQGAPDTPPRGMRPRRNSTHSAVSDGSRASSDPGPDSSRQYEEDVAGFAASMPLPLRGIDGKPVTISPLGSPEDHVFLDPASPVLIDRLAQSFPPLRPDSKTVGMQREFAEASTSSPIANPLPEPAEHSEGLVPDPFAAMPRQELALPQGQHLFHTGSAPFAGPRLSYRRSTFGVNSDAPLGACESPKSVSSFERRLTIVHEDGEVEVASEAGDADDDRHAHLGMTEKEVDELMRDRASSEGSCAQRYIPTQRAEKQAGFVPPAAAPPAEPLSNNLLPSTFGRPGRRESFPSNCSSPSPVALPVPPPVGAYSLSPAAQPLGQSNVPAPLTHLHPPAGTIPAQPPSPYYSAMPSPQQAYAPPFPVQPQQPVPTSGNVSPNVVAQHTTASPGAPLLQQPVGPTLSPGLQPSAPPSQQPVFQPYNY